MGRLGEIRRCGKRASVRLLDDRLALAGLRAGRPGRRIRRNQMAVCGPFRHRNRPQRLRINRGFNLLSPPQERRRLVGFVGGRGFDRREGFGRLRREPAPAEPAVRRLERFELAGLSMAAQIPASGAA
jgi:hypothetical protein